MKKNLLSLLLAAALALCAAGCGSTPPAAEPAEPPAAQTEQSADVSVPDKSITEAVTGLSPDTVVAESEGNTAPAELLTYYIGYVSAYLDGMLRSYGQGALDPDGMMDNGQTASEYIRGEALTMLRQQLVLENLAARHDLSLSAEDEEELARQKEADILEFGEDGYRAELYKLGLSEASYDRVIRTGYLYRSLNAAYAAEGSALYVSEGDLAAAAAEQGYITADHILVMTVDPDTREPLDAAAAAEKRALAADLLLQLRESGDPIALFKTLADEYSEDTGRLTHPDGYTFTHGAMVDEFDAAARALGENEISDIVESVYGCHIILRRPLDAAAAADAVREQYYDRLFLDAVDAAEFTVDAAAESFDAGAIYDAINAARAGDASEVPQANPFAPE